MSASSLVLFLCYSILSMIENANALMLHLSAADYEGFKIIRFLRYCVCSLSDVGFLPSAIADLGGRF